MSAVKNPGITPNRRTHIKFDVAEYSLLEPAFQERRDREQIASGSQSKKEKVKLIDGVGWQLANIEDDPAKARQTTEGNQSIIDGSGLSIAPKHGFTNTWQKVPGVTYAVGVADSGDPFLQKNLDSGDALEQRLSADQTAFPGPLDAVGADYLAPMDRVAVTIESDSATYKEYRFTVILNDSRPSDYGAIAGFYFNGPAGELRDWIGFGQYCLIPYTDGVLYLYERGESNNAGTLSTAWKLVNVSRWAPSGVSMSGKLTIDVASLYPSDIPLFHKKGVIRFTANCSGVQNQGSAQGNLLGFTRSDSSSLLKRGNKGLASSLFAVPGDKHGYESSEVPGRVKPAPIRVDHGQSARPMSQIRQLRYEASGYIADDPFSFPFYPVRQADIVVEFWGSQPAGTVITCKLFNADTNVEIASTSSTAWSATFPNDFDAPSKTGSRNYYVKFTLTSSDGSQTPVLVGYSPRRDGYTLLIEPGEFEADNLAYGGTNLARSAGCDVSIHGAEADPSVASASFNVHDITEVLPKLKVRGELKVQIETEYDKTDASKRSVIFRGYAQEPESVRKGRGSSGYGSKLSTYSINAVSMFQRLQESLSQVRFNFNDIDPLTVGSPGGPRPWKVTDAVRLMFGWAGFPSSMIDVPDLPLRFWPNGTNDTMIEPLASLGDAIMLFVRQWLGMRMVWDDNAGPYGVFRVRYANRPPYNNVCHFVTDSATAGSGKLHMMLG